MDTTEFSTKDPSSPTSPEALKDRSYHHGNLAEALLASALSLLEEGGMEALSLRAVARKAGVSQAAPYHHFKDKRSLLAAVAAEGHRRLAATCLEFGANSSDPVVVLENMGVGYVTFAVENPNFFRLMFGQELDGYRESAEDPDYEAAVARCDEVIATAVQSAFPPEMVSEPMQFDIARVAIWSMVHGLGTLIVDGRVPAPPPRSDAFRTFVLAVFGVFRPDAQ